MAGQKCTERESKQGFYDIMFISCILTQMGVRSILLKIPSLNTYYFKHYATYRFMYFKFKNCLNLLRPLEVSWLITYNCNFKCIHCEASAGSTKVLELTTDEAFRLIDEFKSMGVKRILLSGGEPLVRKDVFLIIEYILSRGIQYGILSNGFSVDKFTDKFMRMKPFMFFTSIDGLEQTNDEIRGVHGAFKKSLDALTFFQSIGVDQRVVNTLVLPNNIRQLPELKKIIQKSAATFWRLAIPIPVGRLMDNEKPFLDKDQLKYLFGFIDASRKDLHIELSEDAGYLGCYALKLRSYHFFCDAGLTNCAVMPDGEVLGCQIAYDNAFSEGNIRTRSFQEIWRNGFSHFRNPQFETKCRACTYLEACRGGCWGMRLGNKHCYKDVWEEPSHN
ncbi:MAG: radical SAM protein [Methanoregula sp.]|nr:radical SAM protein [Methanoregula sp.]